MVTLRGAGAKLALALGPLAIAARRTPLEPGGTQGESGRMAEDADGAVAETAEPGHISAAELEILRPLIRALARMAYEDLRAAERPAAASDNPGCTT